MPIPFKSSFLPLVPRASGAPLVLAGVLAVILLLAGGERRSEASDPGWMPVPHVSPTMSRCILAPLDVGPLPAASGILVEAETGTVLWEQAADDPRPPASLVKMALQLVVFEELRAGRLALTDSVRTSANASTMGGSQVYLKDGEVQTVAALLQAVVLPSANDAAMALAEHVAGDEASFVKRMNDTASRLGCTGTEFVNVHGLDLSRTKRNRSTARDLARIARALVRHPEALELSSTWRAPFRGGEFWLDNTNKLLRDYEGLDGLKTGYTRAAGGCFCGTAERDGVRLISVVMAAEPGRDRFRVTERLLDAAFSKEPRWVYVTAGGEELTRLGPVSVQGAVAPGVFGVAGGEVRVLVERSREAALSRRIRPLSGLDAPVPVGETLGYLDCRIEGRTFASVPLRAATHVACIPPLAPGGPSR